MDKPLLYDVYCGAGGATRGYQMAGFRVIGIDNRPMPRYCGDAFIQMDAFEFFERVARGEYEQPSAWHCSPPCQAYSVANNIHGRSDHPDLIPATRALLETTGGIWVIENVPGSPLRNYVTLCGLSLGCNVKRHRWFESNVLLFGTQCGNHAGDWLLVFGHTVLSRGKTVGIAKGGGPVIRRQHMGTEAGRAAMGIDWMNRDELSEAIPPAYTHWIGSQLIGMLERKAAA